MFSSFKETSLNMFTFYICKYIYPVQHSNAQIRMLIDVIHSGFISLLA